MCYPEVGRRKCVRGDRQTYLPAGVAGYIVLCVHVPGLVWPQQMVCDLKWRKSPRTSIAVKKRNGSQMQKVSRRSELMIAPNMDPRRCPTTSREGSQASRVGARVQAEQCFASSSELPSGPCDRRPLSQIERSDSETRRSTREVTHDGCASVVSTGRSPW